MSAPFYYQLTLSQHRYRILARPGCSRLAILKEHHADVLGAYEPRWLGSSSRGGYWVSFRADIDSHLLLNMDAIARLIEHDRQTAPVDELNANLEPLLNLDGWLRALPAQQPIAA